jgi:hypothetical protein
MTRTFALVAAPIFLVVGLSACGSSDKKSPSTTVVESTINGQQAPGPGGNNQSGNANPNPSAVPTAGTAATKGSSPDTQVKIGDVSPGQGSTP